MFPINWKWLVLAPLTLAALTACPEHSHHSTTTTTEARSRYNGLWINDDAYQSYLTYLKFPDGFCQDVQKHAGIHGANLDKHPEWGNQPHPEVWRVFNNGQVYEWSPTLRANSPELSQSYIGHVHEDGFFVKIPYSTGAGNNVSLAASYVGDNSGRDTATLNFVRDDLIQLFPSDRTIRARKLDRINESIALDYFGRVQACVGGPSFGRNGGFNAGGGQDYVDDQGPVQRVDRRSTLGRSGSDGGAPAPLPAAPRKVVRRKVEQPAAPVDNVEQSNDDQQY